ncbi:MAG: hypothetical protein ACOX7C_03180 [Brevefilum sp.]
MSRIIGEFNASGSPITNPPGLTAFRHILLIRSPARFWRKVRALLDRGAGWTCDRVVRQF